MKMGHLWTIVAPTPPQETTFSLTVWLLKATKKTSCKIGDLSVRGVRDKVGKAEGVRTNTTAAASYKNDNTDHRSFLKSSNSLQDESYALKLAQLR